mgnify:CR=1 FL=1
MNEKLQKAASFGIVILGKMKKLLTLLMNVLKKTKTFMILGTCHLMI